MAKREFDLILWGATGFTGRLVMEYLVREYDVGEKLNWAIAGRSRDKLEKLLADFLPPCKHEQLNIIIADSSDQESLNDMVGRTSVICTTVGPYAKHGTGLLAACAEAGTDYCDLTGEVQWVAKMISDYQDTAEASGARIVHCCGFDSMPFDMGCWFLQQEMLKRHKVPARRVKARIGRTRGAVSGGTVASIINLIDEARRDSSVRDVINDPYALYPAGITPGEDGQDQRGARFDADFHQWTSPFIMAVINTRIVRRSNALLGFPWGKDFRYDEAVLNRSRFKARQAALATALGAGVLAITPTRKLIQRFLPSPGEGPGAERRQEGFYEIFFYGVHPNSRDDDMLVKVTGDMDPGYGSTSKMLAEAAVSLALDRTTTGGGCWTPASALGQALLDRLIERAGLNFEIVK